MSQTAFAQLGVVFLIFGDMDLAEKCATFATLLVDKSWEANKPSAAAGYQAYGMTLSYRKPYQVLMDPLYDLYKRNSGAGDLMSASSVRQNGRCVSNFEISTPLIHFACFLSFYHFRICFAISL